MVAIPSTFGACALCLASVRSDAESEKIRINARRDPRRRFLVPGSRCESHPSALELNLDGVVRGPIPLPKFSGLKPETGIGLRECRNPPLHFSCTFLVRPCAELWCYVLIAIRDRIPTNT